MRNLLWVLFIFPSMVFGQNNQPDEDLSSVLDAAAPNNIVEDEPIDDLNDTEENQLDNDFSENSLNTATTTDEPSGQNSTGLDTANGARDQEIIEADISPTAADSPYEEVDESSPDEQGFESTSSEEVPDTPAPPAAELPPPNEFGGTPDVPGTRRILAAGEAPIRYKVQPGDTLFDICDQLLDEPDYWKKLWSLNPYIKNPHFIYPGRVIRFYPGGDKNLPYMEVVTEDDVVPIDSTALTNTELIDEEVPEVDDADNLDRYADEYRNKFVNFEDINVSTEIQEKFIFAGEMFKGGLIHLNLPGVVYKEEPAYLGAYVGVRYGKSGASKGDKSVFFSPESSIEPGTTYSLVRRSDSVDDRHGSSVGCYYKIVGSFKIDKKLNDEGYYTGTIASNNNSLILPGDRITPYISTKRKFKLQTMRDVQGDNMDSSVIGFTGPENQLGGEGDMIMIDRGSEDGVQEGQVINIFTKYGRHSALNLPEDFPNQELDGYRIGIFRVLWVTSGTAVGYIMDVNEEIAIGDRTTPSAG